MGWAEEMILNPRIERLLLSAGNEWEIAASHPTSSPKALIITDNYLDIPSESHHQSNILNNVTKLVILFRSDTKNISLPTCQLVYLGSSSSFIVIVGWQKFSIPWILWKVWKCHVLSKVSGCQVTAWYWDTGWGPRAGDWATTQSWPRLYYGPARVTDQETIHTFNCFKPDWIIC